MDSAPGRRRQGRSCPLGVGQGRSRQHGPVSGLPPAPSLRYASAGRPDRSRPPPFVRIRPTAAAPKCRRPGPRIIRAATAHTRRSSWPARPRPCPAPDPMRADRGSWTRRWNLAASAIGPPSRCPGWPYAPAEDRDRRALTRCRITRRIDGDCLWRPREDSVVRRLIGGFKRGLDRSATGWPGPAPEVGPRIRRRRARASVHRRPALNGGESIRSTPTGNRRSR